MARRLWIRRRRPLAKDRSLDATARPAIGTIIERVSRTGRVTRTLRFFASGRQRALPLGDVTREEAEHRLRRELAHVQSGTWRPPIATITSPADVPSFHSFAEEWWTLHERELSTSTRKDYRSRLEKHLIDFFGPMALDGITTDTVERYLTHKLAENERVRAGAARREPVTESYTHGGRTRIRRVRPLSERSINMTIVLLGQIMELALERDLITRNPAHGRRCKLPEQPPTRSYTDDAESLAALLEAANDRAVIAVLCFAGLRVGELCALRWRSVDIATGWLTVGNTATGAGVRRVRMRGVVRDELAAIRPADVNPDAYVFASPEGRKLRPSDVGATSIHSAVQAANVLLTTRGLPTLPHIAPSSLRKTFAAVLYALGESPPVVMEELGHTSPRAALAIYARAMQRSEDEVLALRALVEGTEFRHALEVGDERPSTEWPTSIKASQAPGARWPRRRVLAQSDQTA